MSSLMSHFVRISETTLLLSVLRSHDKSIRYLRSSEDIKRYANVFQDLGIRAFLPSRWTIPVDDSLLQNKPLRVTFSTPYEPLEPFRDEFMKTQELHDVVVHYHPYSRLKNSHVSPKRRLLIYLHGWGRPSLQAERLWHFPILQRAYHADILAFELPYHMSRNPDGFSGQGLLDGDPVRTLEGFRQAVIEAMTLYHSLKEQRDVGFFGISLGGHLLVMINLLLQEDFFGLAALVGSPLKENLRRLKISPNLLKSLKDHETARLMSVLDFNQIPVKHQNSRFYLLGGKHDPIIDPTTVLNLGKHLRCPTFIVSSGHFTFSLFLPYITKQLVHWNA